MADKDDKGKKGGSKKKKDEPTPEEEPKKAGRKSAYKYEDVGGVEAGAAGDDAEVIDLEEKRAEKPVAGGLFEGVIGEGLRQALRKFVVENVVPEGQKAGDIDLSLDVDFFRKHGKDLVSTIVQSVAKTVLPEKVEVNLPLGDKPAVPKAAEGGEEAAEEAAAEAAGEAEEDVNVAVKFDFLDFLKGLVAAAPGVEVPAEEAEEKPAPEAKPEREFGPEEGFEDFDED